MYLLSFVQFLNQILISECYFTPNSTYNLTINILVGPPHPGHPERRSIRLMAAGERLSLEGYFTSLYEDEDSDESDEEYMPRDVWKRVRLHGTAPS